MHTLPSLASYGTLLEREKIKRSNIFFFILLDGYVCQTSVISENTVFLTQQKENWKVFSCISIESPMLLLYNLCGSYCWEWVKLIMTISFLFTTYCTYEKDHGMDQLKHYFNYKCNVNNELSTNDTCNDGSSQNE